MNGLIESYNAEKGFGFIKPLVGRPDSAPLVFFHSSVISGGIYLPVGAEVRFDLCRGNQGVQAANLRLVKVRLRCSDEATEPGYRCIGNLAEIEALTERKR